MCGRIELGLDCDSIVDRCISTTTWRHQHVFQPSYNIGPRSFVPVIYHQQQQQQQQQESSTLASSSSSSSSYRILETMQWGYKIGEGTTSRICINSRSDKISWTPWRNALLHRRCVVIAEGFYEWLSVGKLKSPFYITHENKRSILYMAAIFQSRRIEGPHSNAVSCVKNEFSVLTCSSSENPIVHAIHDRMPVILRNEIAVDDWLNPSASWSDVVRLLRPLKHGLVKWPVSYEVNNVKNEGSQLIVPMENHGRTQILGLPPKKKQRKCKNSLVRPITDFFNTVLVEDWLCSVCTLRNPSTTLVCNACGEEKRN